MLRELPCAVVWPFSKVVAHRAGMSDGVGDYGLNTLPSVRQVAVTVLNGLFQITDMVAPQTWHSAV